MTDNEITREITFSEELPNFKEGIKEVFDNYSNPDGGEDPLYISVLRDSYRIVRKAEEEINRQQAEIERLQKLLDDKCDRCIARDKSEAVKEFAERLKEKSFQSFGNYGITRDVVEVCNIDNLVKEMVGEK